MKQYFRRSLVLLSLVSGVSAVSALPVPFVADYTGTSNIVEFIDPAVPVVRFNTAATGDGPFDLTQYFSSDVVNLATGVGSGSNTFVASNGDELYGIFSVQIVPTLVQNIVELIGLATFVGGTGIFDGASGSAELTGTAEFTSQTSANASLHYRGEISLVPEPGTLALLLVALATALPLSRRRRVRFIVPSQS